MIMILGIPYILFLFVSELLAYGVAGITIVLLLARDTRRAGMITLGGATAGAAGGLLLYVLLVSLVDDFDWRTGREVARLWAAAGFCWSGFVAIRRQGGFGTVMKAFRNLLPSGSGS